MTPERFHEITSRYAQLKIALIGDIALDRYLHIDASLAAVSLETGLAVHNVTEVRPQPGAGGNVLANLSALGPAALVAVGWSGNDGEGLELRRTLHVLGVDLMHFLSCRDRMTFTYTKPLIIRPGQLPEELSRIDIRSRTPTPREVEDEIIERLCLAAEDADVTVAMDQVPEPQTGVLTHRVKAALADVARSFPDKIFIADSRTSIGDYRDVRIKANRAEVAHHFDVPPETADIPQLALRWSDQLGQDVFVTMGEDGVVVASKGVATHVPGVPVEPPIDIVGAGDTVLGGIAMALAAGATAVEAAEMGNLGAAVTIKKIGTTGTANIDELRAVFERQPKA